MDKIGMRQWVADLEEMIDNKLSRWKKGGKIENGECVHLDWQFEQTKILLRIFWIDGDEHVDLKCISPRSCHGYNWNGLNDKTFNRVADRIGNLSQIVMHPPVEPED